MKDMNGKWFYKDLTQGIIGVAMEVHRKLGSGFLEYVYEEFLNPQIVKKPITSCLIYTIH